MIEKAAGHARDWRWPLRALSNFVFTRGFVVGLALVAEAGFFWWLTTRSFNLTLNFYLVSVLFSLVMVVRLVSSRTHPSYQLAWAIFMLALPPTGALVYLLRCLMDLLPARRNRRLEQEKILVRYLQQNPKTWQAVQKLPSRARAVMFYLSKMENFPVYQQTQTEFLPLGEVFFERLKEKLRTAKKFIFLEYYIISDGVMWSEILDILHQKVVEGVEVRVMYDDVGSLFTLPTNYVQTLAQYGIKARVLNRFRPWLLFQMNNRDHRKIAVIDGQTGFVSGVNLADEYINVTHQHGHWKDTGVCLTGVAVDTLTVLFLQFWHQFDKTEHDWSEYLPVHPDKVDNDGLIVPFADDPHDHETVAKNVYLDLINRARRQIFLTTPYLVPDNELITALTLAAKNGVEVNLITPGIGDHFFVQMLTESFYYQLMEAGVRIFEYTPGFIHSKTLCVDGELAVVGTINLDFRSLYLLYECGVLAYGAQMCQQLAADVAATVKVSRQVQIRDVSEIHWVTRVMRSLLRLVAPLF
ncbi:cardiolipin synthase [bacterium]|nr:cardiolipin synthase [bacterium]